MSGPKLFEMLAALFERRARGEPHAACRKCQDHVADGDRVYFAFARPQRCHFCGVECQPTDCVPFDGVGY